MLIPPKIPVIVLSDCNLMPHGMLPLFIFEPRYRAMLRHSIMNERFFSIATRKPGAPGESDQDIEPCSTAGLVRACVHHDNGTSHLMLQGIQRIRFTGWEQREPFRIATIEPVVTTISDPGELAALRALCLERAGALLTGPRAASDAARTAAIKDDEILADFLATSFLPGAAQRQALLGMSDLNERFRCLSGLLAAV